MKRTQTNSNSLANLRPPWKPGESGNVGGLPSGFQTPAHWLRSLSTWTKPKLVALVDDQDEPISRRLAARALLDGLHANADVRGRAYDRLNDRLEGRPKQAATITIEKREPTTQELLSQYYSRSGFVPSEEITDGDGDAGSNVHDEQSPQGADAASEITDTPPNDPIKAVVADGVGK